MSPTLPADLSEVIRHVESTYPSEGCGVLLKAERSATWRVQRMQNSYDRYHALDPARFPRTSATAYFFDPKEWLRVCEEADRVGDKVACVYHSHVDVGAYFSQEDRLMAAPEGEPLMPGVSYLVVAVNRGAATAARLFWWENGDFREVAVDIGQR